MHSPPVSQVSVRSSVRSVISTGRKSGTKYSGKNPWIPGQIVILAAILLLGVGCHSMGPPTIKRDRMHYASAVSNSWKEQLLLNIVKSRYGDAPVFLDVTSVVSCNSMESRVSAGAEWQPTNPEDVISLGVASTYTNRPTISYTPMTGEKFARSLMSPVPLDEIMFVIEGGIPADFILGLTIYSFEGFHNVTATGRGFEQADLKFLRLLELVALLSRNKAIESEITQDAERVAVEFHFRSPKSDQGITKQHQAELKSLLGIPPDLDRVRVIFGTDAADPAVIGLRTRSLMQIMGVLGAGVRIQPEHLTDGSAIPVDHSPLSGEFTVHSGQQKPDEAFVAVPYEGLWFWIDRQDLNSKFTLTVVTILFNFLEGGGSKIPAVLSIPTN